MITTKQADDIRARVEAAIEAKSELTQARAHQLSASEVEYLSKHYTRTRQNLERTIRKYTAP